MRWNKKFRVLPCYICVLGVFGLLLLLLSYWRMESSTSAPPPYANKRKDWTPIGSLDSSDKPRLKKLRQLCNAPDRIHAAGEGKVPPATFELIGIIVCTRHGDRGPLVPVRNLSNINCGHRSHLTPSYKQFVASMLNISKTAYYTSFAGPFLKYTVLPSLYRCNVAHLTPQGVVQLIKLGKVLKEAYVHKLELLSYPYETDDIAILSTKFRRTFQSALAFLHGFLPKFEVSQLRVQEGRGVSFCNSNCRCDRVALLDERYDQERKALRKSHPGVLELLDRLSGIVKDGNTAPDITNPQVMRDALLAYACHGHPLPCLDGVCIQPEDITSIISYEEWETKQKKSRVNHRASKLKAYGMFKDIVQAMYTMMRDGKPKFVLFSGHDKTISYIINSLALPMYQLPHYASRLIFEVYRNKTAQASNEHYRRNYFFRIVYNGKDITKHLTFCSAKTVAHFSASNGILNDVSICPINNFDNYIRAENYFAEFNSSNFREACALNKGIASKQLFKSSH